MKRAFEASIRWWQFAKRKREPIVMRGHSDWVRAVAVCPIRETIFTGSRDNSIRCVTSTDTFFETRLFVLQEFELIMFHDGK